MVFVETQSIWDLGATVRAFHYINCAWLCYIKDNGISIEKAKVQASAAYVVYTGERKDNPDTMHLTSVFAGKERDIHLDVKILYTGKQKGSILDQYITFSKLYDQNLAQYGKTKTGVQQAIVTTIQTCIQQGILSEYLSKHRSEVENIMTTMFNVQEVFEDYVYDEKREARRERSIEVATTMLEEHEPLDKIVRYSKLSQEEVQKLADSIQQE